jgi:hypothetical protein
MTAILDWIFIRWSLIHGLVLSPLERFGSLEFVFCFVLQYRIPR